MRGVHRGFTLMELLVAIAIFAVVGIMALSGYNELVSQSETASHNAARTGQVQAAVFRMVQDFEQLEPRPVRDVMGQGWKPALEAQPGTDSLAVFTRAGWTNPAGVQRPTLQRVRYRIVDGKLLRDYWVVVDPVPTSEPVSVEMLDGVRSATLRFMDQSRQWHEQWPPLGYTAPSAIPNLTPIAAEITVELEDWGKIVRLVEVPG